MKIAIVTATYPPYHGGQGRVAALHARALRELGHALTVFTGRRGADSLKGESVVYLRPVVSFGNAAWVPQLFWRLRGYDLVILEYPAFGFLGAVLLWKIFFGRGKRFFIFYHMDPLAGGWKQIVFSLLGFSAPALFRLAEKILVSSRDYAENSRLERLPPVIQQKIREVPPGVDSDFFPPGPCAGEETARFSLAERNLLFVGAMDAAHAFKGLGELLQAFAAVSDAGALLHLVGSGEMQSAYIKRAADLGLGDRVHFHGSLSDQALRELYRCVDALVLPSVSRSEAFGLVLIEAMACGKPVIASNLPGVRTVVKDKETGWLVPPGDTLALAAVLKEALGDRGKLQQMGERARRDVISRFSFSFVRDSLRQLI